MDPSSTPGPFASGDARRTASMLVVSYGPDVLATCIAMLRDHSAAEDVTQEVFGDAIGALATFRGDASPRTWLLSIARNRCIDYLRARKRDPWAGPLDDDARDPDTHTDDGALGSEWFADRSVVLRALDALAEGDRALIVLRFQNGLEYGELATAFGLREGTVRMRVSRALARMRAVLEADAEASSGPATAASPAFGRPLGGARPAAGAPPMPAVRARSSAAVSPGAGEAVRGGGSGAAPGAPQGARSTAAPSSWWSRLEAWARGLREEPAGEERAVASPVGDLGVALRACEPAIVSESLAARLASLVNALAA